MQTAKSLMFITKRPDVTFVRGEGSWLYDEQGRPYLDFIQGWAVNSLGHSPRVVLDALAAQAARVINVSPQYYNEPMCRLADLLTNLSGLDRVFFANSGAEANEGAIKLARKWGSLKRSAAYEIVVFEGAFHGRTLATMSASGKPQWKDLYEPKVPGFVRVQPEDLSAVRKAIGSKTAAVMIEPISVPTIVPSAVRLFGSVELSRAALKSTLSAPVPSRDVPPPSRLVPVSSRGVPAPSRVVLRSTADTAARSGATAIGETSLRCARFRQWRQAFFNFKMEFT